MKIEVCTTCPFLNTYCYSQSTNHHRHLTEQCNTIAHTTGKTHYSNALIMWRAMKMNKFNYHQFRWSRNVKKKTRRRYSQSIPVSIHCTQRVNRTNITLNKHHQRHNKSVWCSSCCYFNVFISIGRMEMEKKINKTNFIKLCSTQTFEFNNGRLVRSSHRPASAIEANRSNEVRWHIKSLEIYVSTNEWKIIQYKNVFFQSTSVEDHLNCEPPQC